MNEFIKKWCEEIFGSIKRQPYKWSFWACLLLMFIPSLIWLSYLLGRNGFIIFSTELSEDGAFSFYSTVLTFIGTLGLGAVSLWQNMQYKRQSDAYNEKIEELTIMPEIFCSSIEKIKRPSISCITYGLRGVSSNYTQYFTLLEPTNNTVVKAKLKDITFESNENELKKFDVFITLGKENNIFHPKDRFQMEFIIPNQFCSIDICIKLIITYENIYGHMYQKEIAFKRDKEANQYMLLHSLTQKKTIKLSPTLMHNGTPQ